jgi:hypothetical protein
MARIKSPNRWLSFPHAFGGNPGELPIFPGFPPARGMTVETQFWMITCCQMPKVRALVAKLRKNQHRVFAIKAGSNFIASFVSSNLTFGSSLCFSYQLRLCTT